MWNALSDCALAAEEGWNIGPSGAPATSLPWFLKQRSSGRRTDRHRGEMVSACYKLSPIASGALICRQRRYSILRSQTLQNGKHKHLEKVTGFMKRRKIKESVEFHCKENCTMEHMFQLFV